MNLLEGVDEVLGKPRVWVPADMILSFARGV